MYFSINNWATVVAKLLPRSTSTKVEGQKVIGEGVLVNFGNMTAGNDMYDIRVDGSDGYYMRENR